MERGIRAGEEIHGPDGMGYRVVEPIQPLSVMRSSHFEPFGGAPDPKAGEIAPEWLVRGLKEKLEA